MRAQPLLDRVRHDLDESCSVGVVEEDEVTYVTRSEVSRIMSIGLRVGSRVPLYCSSMGRVLLAGQGREERQSYLRRTSLIARTEKTQIEATTLLEVIERVAEKGFAIVDQELEPGLRSIAVPLRSQGQIVAAINIGTQGARVSVPEYGRASCRLCARWPVKSKR